MTAMSTFKLKDSSISLNRMGYGAMRLTGEGIWGPPRDEAEAVAVLREAVAAGVNHIDTADYYGPHVTNRLIKKALHPYPAGLTIVTKIGFVRGDDKSWRPAQSAKDLEASVKGNLSNLGLDVLDVVNLRLGGPHGASKDSLAAPLRALADLQKKGLVRHIGLSTVSAEQIAEASRTSTTWRSARTTR
jgi:pyridoxine 4-dehydrogenase